MDGELVSLASSAAATVVTLLATDAWTQVREEIGALWRRLQPGHTEQVADAEAALNRDREEIAGSGGDDGVGRALRADWETRFLRLLGSDAAAAAELARVASELDGLRPDRNVSVRQDGIASDHGTVIQVGGDARIGRLTSGPRE
jgi:hypothetical protein